MDLLTQPGLVILIELLFIIRFDTFKGSHSKCHRKGTGIHSMVHSHFVSRIIICQHDARTASTHIYNNAPRGRSVTMGEGAGGIAARGARGRLPCSVTEIFFEIVKIHQ